MKVKIGGMTCEKCVARVDKAIKELGYSDFDINLEEGFADLRDASEDDRKKIVFAVEDIGYEAE